MLLSRLLVVMPLQPVLLALLLCLTSPQIFSAELNIASVSAAAVDLKSGKVVYRRHADLVMPIASLTKVMTAMVVLDSGQSITEKIQFSEADRQEIKRYFSRIRVGSKLARGEVLRIALMSSENLAAAALANNYPGGRDAFVRAMNKKAKTLGMQDSHFVDSTGLSELNVSTANDLVKMVRAATRYKDIKRYSSTAVHTANFSHPRYRLAYVNTNSLVRYERWSVALSKTGYLDEAGRCLVMQTKINGRQMVLVLLDSFGKRSPVGDAGRIKKWIENGSTGRVASAAREYQKARTAEYLK